MKEESRQRRTTRLLDETLLMLRDQQARIAFAEYIQEHFSSLSDFIRGRASEEMMHVILEESADKRAKEMGRQLDEFVANTIMLVLGYMYRTKLVDLESNGFEIKGGKVTGVKSEAKPAAKRRRSLNSGN
jgi:hypothetical protein